ncbi:hypothetical protein J7E51_12855 [Priestia megaterium]|nr:hypothetical protein [Priestia megaterium]
MQVVRYVRVDEKAATKSSSEGYVAYKQGDFIELFIESKQGMFQEGNVQSKKEA